MSKMQSVDEVVYYCWHDPVRGSINSLNEAINAENEGGPCNAICVKSPMEPYYLMKDAVYSLGSLPGEPEKIEEIRSKLAVACNAGLYFSLRFMNFYVVLHDKGSLYSMSSAASEYAKCLKELGFDVPKETLDVYSKTKKQIERLNNISVQEELEEWLASWINSNRVAELRFAIFDLYNSLISVDDNIPDYIDEVNCACEKARAQPCEGIDTNELEDMLSNVELYLSINSTLHTMISNAQKAVERKDWYKQEFQPIERPAWAKKKS